MTTAAPFSVGARLRRCERGSALVLALTAGMLLFALGSALVLIASTESAISANTVRAAQMQYLAEAATRRAIVDLDSIADWSDALSGRAGGTFRDGPPDGIREVSGATVDFASLRASLTASANARPFGTNNPRWEPFVWGPAQRLLEGDLQGYVVVWVGDDPAEQDGAPTIDGGAAGVGGGRLLLHAQAFGARDARRAVEVAVARQPPDRARVMTWHLVR